MIRRAAWRLRSPFLVAFLFAACASASHAALHDASAAAKMDGTLRHLLRADPPAHLLAQSRVFESVPGKSGEPRVGVVFVADARPAVLDDIAGASIGTVTGEVYTAYVPLSSVERLALAPEVVFIEASVLLQPFLDESIPMSRVDEVWSAGYTGSGALVGVIDTGIDFTHDDFRKANGDTRIKFIYDRVSDAQEIEYDETEINAHLSSGSGVGQIDADGHGTHVTATAAGNGRESTGTYVGVAQDANIIFYKAFNGSGLPTSWVIDGLNKISTKATELGMPVAINMSLGGQFGAHDGTSTMETVIGTVSGPGKVVVIAAGNDGESPIHFDGTGTFTKTLNVSHGSGRYGVVDYVWFDIWYDGLDAVSVRVEGPVGFDQTFVSGTFAQSGDASNGSVYVDNASAGINPLNGDKQCVLILGNTGQVGTWGPADGSWSFTFQGASNGAVHGWRASQFAANGEVEDADYSHLVAVPGTSPDAITVGAYVSRTCWPSQSGTRCTWNTWGGSWSAVSIPSAAPFTSPGPSRDGRLKPEIAGPGMEIMAALSKDASTFAVLTAPDGKHQILQGTSMSSPHVAGVVGLMLEADPLLTPAGARSALVAGAEGLPARGAGISTLFDTNFEGGASGWTNLDGGATSGDTWAFGTQQSRSPSTGAMVDASLSVQQETLVSPAISLPFNRTPILDFWHGASNPSLANGDHHVGVRSAGSGDAFTILKTFPASAVQTFPDPASGSAWVPETGIDLSSWAGQSVELGWIYNGVSADSWFVDDVRVTAASDGSVWSPWIGYGRMDAKASVDAATPIEIESFVGLAVPGGVLVSWYVTDLASSHGFVLERAPSFDDGYRALHEGLLPSRATMRFLDRTAGPDRAHYYRLVEETTSGRLTHGPIEVETHGVRSLSAVPAVRNVPNPFNPRTSIEFVLAAEQPVSLEIFDLSGRKVRTLVEAARPAGVNRVVWDGRDDTGRELGSGTYYYRLTTSDGSTGRRMVLAR